jgi:hypothetical protein
MAEEKKGKAAWIVWAIDAYGKIDFVLRNEYEVKLIQEYISGLGLVGIAVPIYAPPGFYRWYYPRPMLHEPSEN